jgi:hypothetical protein
MEHFFLLVDVIVVLVELVRVRTTAVETAIAARANIPNAVPIIAATWQGAMQQPAARLRLWTMFYLYIIATIK